MCNARFSKDFKRDAVHQITTRGYPVAEVSKRMGVSTHSLFAWVKKYSKSAEVITNDDHATENRRLKWELARVAVMLYVRFPLSLRNVEDLLHERGIDVSHETIRFWWNRFGRYSRRKFGGNASKN